MSNVKISQIATHDTAPIGTHKLELEKADGTSVYSTIAEMFAQQSGAGKLLFMTADNNDNGPDALAHEIIPLGQTQGFTVTNAKWYGFEALLTFLISGSLNSCNVGLLWTGSISTGRQTILSSSGAQDAIHSNLAQADSTTFATRVAVEASNANACRKVRVLGAFLASATGTVTPQFQFNTTPSNSSMKVLRGSFVRVWLAS